MLSQLANGFDKPNIFEGNVPSDRQASHPLLSSQRTSIASVTNKRGTNDVKFNTSLYHFELPIEESNEVSLWPVRSLSEIEE